LAIGNKKIRMKNTHSIRSPGVLGTNLIFPFSFDSVGILSPDTWYHLTLFYLLVLFRNALLHLPSFHSKLYLLASESFLCVSVRENFLPQCRWLSFHAHWHGIRETESYNKGPNYLVRNMMRIWTSIRCPSELPNSNLSLYCLLYIFYSLYSAWIFTDSKRFLQISCFSSTTVHAHRHLFCIALNCLAIGWIWPGTTYGRTDIEGHDMAVLDSMPSDLHNIVEFCCFYYAGGVAGYHCCLPSPFCYYSSFQHHLSHLWYSEHLAIVNA